MHIFKYLIGRVYEYVERPLYLRVLGYSEDDKPILARSFDLQSDDLVPTKPCPSITELRKAGVDLGHYSIPNLNGIQAARYESSLVHSTLADPKSYVPKSSSVIDDVEDKPKNVDNNENNN